MRYRPLFSRLLDIDYFLIQSITFGYILARSIYIERKNAVPSKKIGCKAVYRRSEKKPATQSRDKEMPDRFEETDQDAFEIGFVWVCFFGPVGGFIFVILCGK